ncbi:ELKS/Rab6-interacting/CAST family member 1-like isoform X2 [Lineus longissimus]|uniref:ELKS/Rab6-interacting/CAST family member 1-like isoform X2 n=1 Tax=Lineus longissimus TaxID=88925 RepID=UPI002B4CE2FE
MSRTSSTFGRQSPLHSARSPSKSTGGSLRRSNSMEKLRCSTGNIAASFSMNGTGMTGPAKMNKSTELSNIEQEYIKNLQQQIYFLELEANYLREQARKATDMHPVMTSEAERMLAKLRQMQTESDGLRLELSRKDGNLDYINTEKMRLLERLKTEEDNHAREKRLLMDEVVQFRKESGGREKDIARKDLQLDMAKDEMEKSTTALRAAEQKITLLRNQLDQRIEQHKMTQLALDEKRGESLRLETQLREVEEKYYSSAATMQDKATQDLRDEIRMLRQKLKETEIQADQDRYLRNKISDDSSHLVKENALLNQQVIELENQNQRERGLRESQDTRRSMNITELVSAKDHEKQLQFEINQLREQLNHEKERCNHYMAQLAKQEQIATSTEFNASSTRSRLAEVENAHHGTETENSQLRRDKMLLVDHVADLQKQLTHKEQEIVHLHAQIHSLDTKVSQFERLKILEGTVNSQKWEEFERLADSMKSLSATMAQSSSPRMTRTVEYS